MSLPTEMIDRVFAVMGATYGSKFADMWAGSDPMLVKDIWAERLGGFSHRPDILREALRELDGGGWPPTLPEFIESCRVKARRMSPAAFNLPAPELAKIGNKAAGVLK